MSSEALITRKRCAKSPNDPKLSDRGVRRGTCTVGGKAAVEAGAVTHGAVRCSAWLGDLGFGTAVNLRWVRGKCWKGYSAKPIVAATGQVHRQCCNQPTPTGHLLVEFDA